MLTATRTATLRGVLGYPVTVEIHLSPGIGGFSVVGLPGAACREAQDRVRAALQSCEVPWPRGRITVNLAPSGERKEGAGLDLAIAIGLLVIENRVPRSVLDDWGFIAELGLDGSLRRVPGTLNLVEATQCQKVVVAPLAYPEASLVKHCEVRTAENLAELIACLNSQRQFREPPSLPPPEPPPIADLSDIKGQRVVRNAMEIAAAGGHHMLMVGAPGAGKTMLAHRMVGLLPKLDYDTALEATRIHSAAGLSLPKAGIIGYPPLRAPHHTMSSTALVGGGSGVVRPGEMSAAHGGVLFLDELGEFAPVVLDTLRQPVEEGTVRISRATGTFVFPARILLLAAMNPCPCGELGSPGGCRCSAADRARYTRRVSGPLLDRFDLRVQVHRPTTQELMDAPPGESTEAVRQRVMAAREIAARRGVRYNAELSDAQLDEEVVLTEGAKLCLAKAIKEQRLSGRGYKRVRCVALTIRDLAEAGGDSPVSGGPGVSASVIDDKTITQALLLRTEPFADFNDGMEVG